MDDDYFPSPEDVAGEDGSYHYGSFLGGDPRTFRPDPESITPSELECWEEACVAADRVQVGKPCEEPSSGFVQVGDRMVHIQATMYGHGTQYLTAGPWKEWLSEIKKRLA